MNYSMMSSQLLQNPLHCNIENLIFNQAQRLMGNYRLTVIKTMTGMSHIANGSSLEGNVFNQP